MITARFHHFPGPTLLILVCATGSAQGQDRAPHEHGLGIVNFPVSCSAAARLQFNRAVALLHHMTYPRAREAFEQVAATDQRCAMAHWGVAVTLFQPLWPTRPSPADLRRGWEEVRKAQSPGPPTRRERLFIETAAAFFRDPDSTNYWQRIQRWEQATAKLLEAFPEDPEARTFRALALLATLPSDRIDLANAERAAALLLSVYRDNPAHPGAMHYLVHANDAPGRERELLDVTRKYDSVAPDNPHALHMPTHIYVRLGDWDAVVRGNVKAAHAALAYPAGDQGQFVWDEFPHAIEYVVYAWLQLGADDSAFAQLTRLHATPRLEPSFKTAFHLASTRARYALERQAWNEAAQLPARHPPQLPWDRFVWPEAITWYARGLGEARGGSADQARDAVAQLGALEGKAASAGEDLFRRNIRILRLGVEAWLAHRAQASDSSVRLMQEAIELEITTPKHAVTPGPTLPAIELLGDLLLEQKQPSDALAAYRRSLELYPRRFNSLLGAARAAGAAGDSSTARKFYETLLQVAGRGSRTTALSEARRFVEPR
jgi:tetratricopeptide (TPR) repeat protein